ncbi:MAG: hypothetical protein U0325_10260 [Polyangiales bacterium]
MHRAPRRAPVLASLLLLGCAASVAASAPDAVDDAGPAVARRWPTARMVWQAPGGFANWGLAVMITGDGVARGWVGQPAFDPLGVPPPHDTRVTLPGIAVDALFDRWSRVATVALPHGPGGAGDCLATVTVRPCDTCPPARVAYRHPAQVTPEMNAVWDWFHDNLPASDLSTWCAF